MATRLDRLLVLLDSGSTAVTRKAAAQQLGEVQKLHPHELHNLLNKVHTFLKSKSWDTRIAAAQAIEAIVQNVPKWEPEGFQIKVEPPEDSNSRSSTPSSFTTSDGRLLFSQFDILKVLQFGEPLLGSAGDEFEEDPALEGLCPQDQLARQKQLVSKRLGLDIGVDLGIDSLIDDEDLVIASTPTRRKSITKQSSFEKAAEIVANEIAAIGTNQQLSSREKNIMRRKVKKLAKQRSKDQQDHTFTRTPSQEANNPPPAKRLRRMASVVVDQPGDDDKLLIDQVGEIASFSMEDLQEWPFGTFTTELCNELFHPSWEVRHGAASGLREIVKVQGEGAGKTKDTPQDQMEIANMEWLEDTALRLLCVFALDRFGDYASFEVVAPVKESCAQCLGAVLHHMKADSTRKVLNVLLKLQEQTHWQVRHGGLLGVKYMLAVKKEMTSELLPQVLPWITRGLQDGDDDVRAVAASALFPISEELVKSLPEKAPEITRILWEILVELDDLTASTSSVMNLLSSLLSQKAISLEILLGQEDLSGLVPRVWPFLSHNISSVRSSALKTFATLLAAEESTPKGLQDCRWLQPVLQDQLRYVFQRFILEPNEEILQLVHKVWCRTVDQASSPSLHSAVSAMSNLWFMLLVASADQPIDSSFLYPGNCQPKVNTPKLKAQGSFDEASADYLGGIVPGMDPCSKDSIILRNRLSAARGIGVVLRRLSSFGDVLPNALGMLHETLRQLLNSNSATQRMTAAMVITEWATEQKNCKCPEVIIKRLHGILNEQLIYDELIPLNQRLQIDVQGLVCCFLENRIDISGGIQPGCFNLDAAASLTTKRYNEMIGKLSGADVKISEMKRRVLLVTVGQMQNEFQKLHTRVQCSIACACVALGALPDKLNPIIRPTMDGIKKEEDSMMQGRAALTLSKLLVHCAKRSPCPNAKIVKNLCAFVCSDPNNTPSTELSKEMQNNVHLLTEGKSEDYVPSCNVKFGILTLHRKQKEAIKAAAPRRSKLSKTNSSSSTAQLNIDSNTPKTKRGNNSVSSGVTSVALPPEGETEWEEETPKAIILQRRGGEIALSTMAREIGIDLPNTLPALWELCHSSIRIWTTTDSTKQDEQMAQSLIQSLQVLEVTATSLHENLGQKLIELLPPLIQALRYPYTAVRHMASRELGVLSKVITMETMEAVIERVLPLLGTSDNVMYRQGGVETIYNIIDNLGIDVLPYVVLLIVPLLGRMSDQVEDIRLAATNCFATLVRLMPLEAGIPDPPKMSKSLIEQKNKERRFLEQLMDTSKLDSYKIPIPIKAQLRKYQQDGVNWLAFLNKYNLHGILCDDMGLGKTLQSICIIAGEHFNKKQMAMMTGNEDRKPLPSIVICPPTLTGHWVYEIEKFCEREVLNPLHYTGAPGERHRLQSRLNHHNVVIASYDIVRNDCEFFLNILWSYCILDEGHIIKNSKTKLSRVIKQLKADHRVILSGTPIQNNVLELWSLFDFLMPGFLGTEKQFTAIFGKPILQSRDAKSSSKEQEAGVLAMEALHRQTLPFLLRRLKEDVLQDLPPKIIQDYYCELSPLQVQLYEDFARSRAKKSLEDDVDKLSTNDEDQEIKKKKNIGSTHIFQALQYLRKVCNHPSLVLTQSHPEYERITRQLKQANSSLKDIQHAAKLVALRQLLQDCGIGVASEDSCVVSQHRALIFCQLKSVLDLVEYDLLKMQMPGVTYLRLDGGTPVGSRQNIVHRFNNDPSIDCLLLTTHVGGLGLNLTGADTVIFVEHDWNPTRDLQAMDRAHRIGQKKVVNVYRLITRGTLEEKIMGLQKFKLSIANTIISQDNSSLQSMDTSQLLDLFTADDTKKPVGRTANGNDDKFGKKGSAKAVLDDLGELWDEKQYETEYDLNSFMLSLNEK